MIISDKTGSMLSKKWHWGAFA